MRKKLFMMMVFCTTLFTTNAAEADYNVIPLPQSIAAAKGAPFKLDASACIVYAGADIQMKQNAGFLSEYVEKITGVKLNVVDKKNKKTPAVVLTIDSKIKGKEAYRIQVSNQTITISGSTAAGVFYGIQTLRKALPVVAPGEEVLLPAVVINDQPRFGYRGMHLDCARHFFPIDFVKKYIDILALHNMNVFHWHLTDDQGWRLEIKKYPKLTQIGSMRSGTVMGHNSDVDDAIPYGGFYTQEQAREIVEYARMRHITVIPEIDLPGHTRAALAAYPEYGCTGGPYEVGHTWGVYFDVLCLGQEKTYRLVLDILDEVLDIFPSEYIHIGGDETPTRRWSECPRCQKLATDRNIPMKKIQAYFTNRIEKHVNEKGRRIIGWDEILGGDINQSATIMSWTGIEPGEKAARLGHDVIMTPSSHLYFDHYQTQSTGSEPMAIGGYSPIEKVYGLDPAPDTLPESSRTHILGVQANLWTEYITCPNQAEYMVMPRMAALAEIQWTPTAKKDFEQFKSRMTRFAKLYDHYGYVYAWHLWPERYNHNRSEW
ncbi:MAG: beta-N-acetylhexosaminidase [Prevotellaceae bacterium]|nr:beta-N-acetylhexosaminidase [Prevotella sp.]MDD7257983.1 beta-N-acetylhexosaminidase [Prevotellaceae bacterium]MDY6131467.1 beta-N-acetylhexosaminidase [Prevotella sp.]